VEDAGDGTSTLGALGGTEGGMIEAELAGG